MVTGVTVTFFSKKMLAVKRKMIIFARPKTIMTMEDKKEQTVLALVRDEKTRQMLTCMHHNWDVAVSRMEQITKERKAGLYDDSGVEVMGVFNRMERVGTLLFALKDSPQALLLSDFRELLKQMKNDHRMDCELALLMNPQASEMKIDAPTIWGRMKLLFQTSGEKREEDEAEVRKLMTNHYLPHMDDEQTLGWMKTLAEPAKEDEVHKAEQQELIESMALLGDNIGKVATSMRQQMAMGLLLIQQTATLMADWCDIRQMEPEAVFNIFELSKKELLESKGWHEYWKEHLNHLSLHGELKKQLKQDQEEVEAWLIDVHDYLYNKWNESPEAFGEALQQQTLTDDELLLLLFHLAKKDAIALEQEEPDVRRQKMEENAFETAMRLYDLAEDKYFEAYETIWQQIIHSEPIAALLLDFNSSKYNQGFNMMCLCKIIGYLHREYHFYGSHTPEDLGKVLGDRYVKNSYETFRDYIKKRETMLNKQCFSEIEDILKNIEKE